MTAARFFEALFAAAVLLTALVLFGTAAGRLGRRAIVAATGVVGAAAAAGWIVFALDPDERVGVAAGGLTACTLAAAAAVPLRAAIANARRAAAELAAAESHLRVVAEREAGVAASELERLVARARADSLSLYAEEERRLGEERRSALAEWEQSAGAELAERLAGVQRRVERRLASWAEDLDRAQQHLVAQRERLDERQAQLIAEAETRITADVERLATSTDEQRSTFAHVRDELGRAAEQLAVELRAELEAHAAERRRALHELGERLRRRERDLSERIEREAGEAAQRIHAGVGDVERRAVEEIERATERATNRYSEEAALQFSDAIKRAREDAARRLARELDRAVESYAREASTVLAERLAHVGDAGAQRVEKRMSQISAGLERQRDELVAGLDQRLSDAEAELRRHLQRIATDAESERAVLDARLQELARRIDESAARSAAGRLSAAEAPRGR